VLSLSPSVKIYLWSSPTDMRKGHDGLFALVRQCALDPFTGHFFVFVSKQRNRLKILTWTEGGFVVLYKRLERGRFKVAKPTAGESTVHLDSSQLSMLLDGVDYSRVRRPKLWRPQSHPG
jgi:transposase